MSDETRTRILARRSVLIAAALATTTTACPKACLSAQVEGDGGATNVEPAACLKVDPGVCLKVGPRPCLEPMPVAADAGAPSPDAGAKREAGITLAPMDIVADSGAGPWPGPLVCLSRIK